MRYRLEAPFGNSFAHILCDDPDFLAWIIESANMECSVFIPIPGGEVIQAFYSEGKFVGHVEANDGQKK